MLYNGDAVNMNNAPTKVRTLDNTRWVYTTTNALGEKRNLVYYWNNQLEKNPHYFSKKNVGLIRSGKAPIADPKWINYHESHANWIGQKLEHHHENHGSIAKALPEKAHRGKGNFNLWHYSNKKLENIKKGSKANGLSILPIFDPSEWSGAVSGRQGSYLHGLKGVIDPKVGVLYPNALETQPGNHFIIREMNEIKNKAGEVLYYHSVVDYYGGTLDGYQQADESTFIMQIEFRETPDGKILH